MTEPVDIPDPDPAPRPIPDQPNDPTPTPAPDLPPNPEPGPKPIPPAARRALAEAAARRQAQEPLNLPPELGGRDGPEPIRYGDWEKKGLAIDF